MEKLSRVNWLFLFFIHFSLFPIIVSADIDYPIIVELQITGEKSSDDFIKIYNPTGSDVYLGNFQGSYLRLIRKTKTGAKDYPIKSWFRDKEAKIPAHGYFILANKDYTALSGVSIFTSLTLSVNNGIALRMGPENTGQIIDAVGWGNFSNISLEGKAFPSNPVAQQKLERKLVQGAYQDTNDNSQDFYLDPPSKVNHPKDTPVSEKKPPPDQSQDISADTPLENSPEAPPSPAYPSGVIINEILPLPTGPDGQEETIELFNQNDFEVSLSGWKIRDKVGKISTYILPDNQKISGRGFLVLSAPLTKISLNNDNDGVELLWPDGKVVDTISYTDAIRGSSYNRTSSGWVWSSVITPGKENIVSQKKDLKTEKESSDSNNESDKENSFSPEKDLLASGEQNVPHSPLPLLLALILSVFSAIIILVLKQKFKNKNL